jgi:ribonuclease-3
MQDPKTALQEKVQAEGNTHHIEYRLISETGPEHDKEFLVELYIDNEKISEGKGRNRKTAEKVAAAAALERR